jgi:hypothetical protein
MDEHYFEAPKYSVKDLIKSDFLKDFTPEQDSLTKVIGNGTDTIKIVKNFMPEKDIELVLSKVNSIYRIPSSVKVDLASADLKILEYIKKIKEKSENFFNIELDYDEDVSPSGKCDSYIAGRKKDFVTLVHSDKLGPYTEKHKKYNWSGHISNLIYLNDNYDGGELYFPHHDLKIKPEPGMLISFPGNWWNRHGILPASDLRFALSVFFKIKNLE